MLSVILLTLIRIILTGYLLWFVFGSLFYLVLLMGSKTKREMKINIKGLINVWRIPFIKLKEIIYGKIRRFIDIRHR